MDFLNRDLGRLILSFFILFFLTIFGANAQYCASTASNGEFEFINNVEVGSINSETTSNLYSDYTASHSTDMYIGESYPIVITNEKHDVVDQIACWIDWNQNEIFEESEKVALSYTGVSSQESDATGTVVPPADAALGSTRMRVTLVGDYVPEPCLNFVYGEVEDYSINVVAVNSVPDPDFNADRTEIFTEESIELTDLSTMVPTSWSWTVFPSTISFIEGTDAHTQNPVISFNEEGLYTVTLEAANGIGSATKTYTDYIQVKPFSKPKYTSATTEGKHVDITWSQPNIAGSFVYVNIEDAVGYTNFGPERAVRFTADDLGFSYPVTVTELSSYFYENLYVPWDDDNFKFRIYDADTTTVLYESEQILAIHHMEMIHTLPTPMTFTDDFFVAVVPMGVNTEEEYTPNSDLIQVVPDNVHSFIGNPGNWDMLSYEEAGYELATAVYITGDNKSKSKIDYLNGFDLKSINSEKTDQIVFDLAGYELYRNGVMIKEINDLQIEEYRDVELDNGTYEYYLKATYSPFGVSPESDTATIVVDNSAPEFMLLYLDEEFTNNDEVKLSHNIELNTTEVIEFGIYNEGGSDLIIDTINLDQVEFELTKMPSKSISAGDTSYFEISFTPTIDGPVTVNIEVVNNDANEGSTNLSFTAVGGLDQWTWMLYLLEDDQGLDGLKDINEWEVNGSIEGYVNYLVLYNSNTDANDGVWYIRKDETGYNRTLVSDKVTNEFGVDPDLSDPAVLEAFLLWVNENYPARNYGLTMWDHGDGIFKKGEDKADVSKAFVGGMTLWEMSKAVESFVETSGSKLNVIGFDVCLLGQFETVYQFKDLAEYVIASELTEPGDGWDYTTGFAPMTSNPYITPEEIAINITDTYTASYMPGGTQGRSASTQAATSVATMNDEFIPVFNDLSDRLSDVVYDYETEIELAMDAAWCAVSIPGGYETSSDHRDLGGFLENLAKNNNIPSCVRSKAQEALDIYNVMIVAEGHTEEDTYTDGATGLKIWMPKKINNQSLLELYYTNPDLYLDISETRWDEFLYELDDPSSSSAPIADFYVPDTAELDVSVMLTNTSYFAPTNFEWTITPSTYEYVNGTSSTSKSPMVKFSGLGKYTISLKVTNAFGEDTYTHENCIEVVSAVLEAPQNLSYTQDENVVNLTWSAGTGTALIDEGFEELTVFPPEGWSILSNNSLDGSNLDHLGDSTNTWGLCDESSFGDPMYMHTGLYSLAIGYTAGMNGDSFNWFISPEVTIRTNDILSFWMLYGSDDTYYTNFDVMIYADEKWTSLQHYTDGSAPNLYYEPIVIPLTDYEGKKVKIAFVYEYSDGYEMAIDDILINNNSKGESYKENPIEKPTHTFKQRIFKPSTAKTKGHTAKSFNVYRNDVKIGSVTDLTVYSYQDIVQEKGTYTYYVTKEYSEPEGESDHSNTVSVTVDEVNGIDDLNENTIKIYPNPATQFINIETDLTNISEIRIIDISGVVRKSVIYENKIQQINIEDLNLGIYTIQIITEYNKINKRLIIK